MAQPIRNPGSTPIYRKAELLLQALLEVSERVPNHHGLRTVSSRMIETMLDVLCMIGLAVNELSLDAKYELLTSVYVQMRTVKTCIDTLKEWSNKSLHVRIISNRQMPQLCEKLEEIQTNLAKWRSSVVGKNSH